ncbi:MAG TPA: GrpB family protein [Micropepsaceae bacterium]|nr:GrpB family protein [Micropepsaceae bacterium]
MTDDQEIEDRLRAATIGTPKVLNGPIFLKSYNPEWPMLYDQLERRIRTALGSRALLVEHVGSTSVPGLSAKPIIDIVMAVADSNDEPSYVPSMASEGYKLTAREPDWFAHRFFKSLAPEANIHVFTSGCEEIARMIQFRDRLRANAADRARYEQTKKDLACRTWKYVQMYADAKSEIVREILARSAAADSGSPPCGP